MENVKMNERTRKARILLVISCILYSFKGLITITLTYSNALIVERAQNKELNGMVYAIVISVILAICTYVCTASAAIARLSYISNRVLALKSDIIKSIFRRPLHSFLGKDDAYYLNLLSTDIELYRTDVLNIYPFIFSSVASVVFASLMLLKLHYLLLLSGLIMSLLPIFTGKPFTVLEQKYKTLYSNHSEKYTNSLRENIEGYESIRLLVAEEGTYHRFMESSAKKQEVFSRYAFVNTISFETLCSLAGLSNIVCLGLGGYLVVKGHMSAAMLFAASNYFVSISNGVNNITNYSITIKSSRQVKEKLLSESKIVSEEDTLIESELTPDITYDHVSFGFGDRMLYDGLNFKFKAGGCYAIVGESGSGKSTITRLLLKYYTNYTGEIRINNMDIRNIPDQMLYGMIGVVNQSPYLFNASLYENITMFSNNPSQDDDAYKQILKDVHLEELAKRVGNQPLGDFGDLISGGERQRINIARSLCRKNKILILDEPTTGLDPENVKLINQFIFSYKDITRIVITHNWDRDYLNNFDDIVTIQF